MNLATQLREFKAHAITKGLDLAGDEERFFSLKTARAWTAWIAAAKTA